MSGLLAFTLAVLRMSTAATGVSSVWQCDSNRDLFGMLRKQVAKVADHISSLKSGSAFAAGKDIVIAPNLFKVLFHDGLPAGVKRGLKLLPKLANLWLGVD
jgi:hypothetical protein